mgnify:CR=1 FL=1
MLGIFYINNRDVILDFKLIFLTAVAIISKENALRGVVSILKSLKADANLIGIAARQNELVPMPPPGSVNIVKNREGIVDL